MRNTNFYTRSGDRGTTSRLRGQSRVEKTSHLIDTLGTIDEATSIIGLARASAQSTELKTLLNTIQHHTISLMSHISATPEAREMYPGLTENEVKWLEDIIAKLEQLVPTPDHFVIPGDSRSGAVLHVARTVVRRAERKLLAFAKTEPAIGRANAVFMNRLSSLLFVAALVEDHLAAGSL
jgi:cob(I)alamin adenosyltransferase